MPAQSAGSSPGPTVTVMRSNFSARMFCAQLREQYWQVFQMLALGKVGNDAAERPVDGDLRRHKIFDDAHARRAGGARRLKQSDTRLIARCFDRKDVHGRK